MQNVMMQTKLPKDICARVWELSNPEQEERFSKKMFYVAMQLMYKKKKDMSIDLPLQIPIELLKSVEEIQETKP